MDDQTYRIKKANGYSNYLIEKLRLQRQQNQDLCDLCICVENQTFYTHKCLMIASCDYFDALVRSGMQETRQDLIELKDITSNAMKIIIDFIYSGELKLNLESIDDILRAVCHLQVKYALKLCEEYLIEETTLDNCIDMLNISDLFTINSVRDAVNKYILRNFPKLVLNEQFKKFSYEQFSYLLQSNKLRLYPEIQVFNTVVKWLKKSSNENDRMKYASSLMKYVRFHTMRPEEFIDVVSKTDFMKFDLECNKYLIEAYEYFALPSRQYTSSSERSLIRNEPVMVCINESMYILNKKEEIWQYLCHSNATCKILSQKFVVVNNFLYACGGYSEIIRETTNKCHRFDPRNGTWTQIACMNEKRQFFTLCSNNDFIVAVGGVNGDKGNFYATFPVQYPLELYSIEKDSWKCIDCDVPVLKWAGACAFNQNKLFIVGGKLTDGHKNIQHLSMKSYIVDLSNDKVILCDPPITTRFNPSVFYSEDDNIILFGGEDEKYRLAPCIEIYNLVSKQWSEVAIIPVSLSYQCISSTYLTNNKIYYLLEEHGPSSESYILKSSYFDINTYSFDKSTHLPNPSTLASKWCHLIFPQEYLEKCQQVQSTSIIHKFEALNIRDKEEDDEDDNDDENDDDDDDELTDDERDEGSLLRSTTDDLLPQTNNCDSASDTD